MEVVLSPILKIRSLKSTSEESKVSRVRFSLPQEQAESVIRYLSEDSSLSFSRLNDVIKTILLPETQDDVILKWLKEFRDNIFFLDQQNEKIVLALLKLNWPIKENEYILVYQELVLNLVSAHSFYLKHVLNMITNIFNGVQKGNETLKGEDLEIFNNAHTLLNQILHLMPSAPNILCSILTEHFPYMNRPAYVHECYVWNLLNICKYLPSKRMVLLESLVGKVIFIDVNCSKDLIELYEEENEQNELMFEEHSEFEQRVEISNAMVFPLANTLDVILNTIFKFIHEVCCPSGKLNWEATKKLYKELLTIFDKIILPTRESCHVQFILFYICSLKTEICQGFLDYLWKKVQNPNVAPVVRQIAAFYIGSLLSRASYVDISLVKSCFDLMCNWIHRYIDNQDMHSAQDVKVHGTFHSVCQSVFYVFAFRHKEFIETNQSYGYFRTLNFDRIVTCRLNPLKYCNKTIVQNFANIARNFQIAYCFPVIEKNNRSLLCSSIESSIGNISGALIPTFFPFDPYLLKKSKHWVNSVYRIYNSKEEPMEEDSILDTEILGPSDPVFSYASSPGFKKIRLKIC